jgi:hypothetical protein
VKDQVTLMPQGHGPGFIQMGDAAHIDAIRNGMVEGFVSPSGRFLSRQEAFDYADKYDLIAPQRLTEARRYQAGREEIGGRPSLISEWLR